MSLPWKDTAPILCAAFVLQPPSGSPPTPKDSAFVWVSKETISTVVTVKVFGVLFFFFPLIMSQECKLRFHLHK